MERETRKANDYLWQQSYLKLGNNTKDYVALFFCFTACTDLNSVFSPQRLIFFLENFRCELN